MLEWKVEIKKRLAGSNLKPEREVEILDELSNDLQDRYDELRSQGLTHEEAFRDVIGELDATDLAFELRPAEEISAHIAVPEGALASGQLFWDFLLDLRYAARTLRKFPGFTAVAVLTLALGIGANTAVFTVINTLLLNPLPVEKISTLVALNTTQAKKTAQLGDLQALSFQNLKDIRERTHAFSSLAGHSSPMAVTMTDKAEPHRIFMELVTANYFDTLGIRPYLGRFFFPTRMPSRVRTRWPYWVTQAGKTALAESQTSSGERLSSTTYRSPSWASGPKTSRACTRSLVRICGYPP